MAEGYLDLGQAGANTDAYVENGDIALGTDFDIRAKFAPLDLTPPHHQVIVYKWLSTGDQLQFAWRLNSTGHLQFFWSPDGSSNSNRASSATVGSAGYSDGETLWVRVTLDVDNGASEHVVTFYTSDDGSSWTQLGAVQSAPGTTSIFNGTANVHIGENESSPGNFLFDGKVFYVEIRDGVGGNVIANPDFRTTDQGDWSTGGPHNDDHANAWTIQGTDWVYSSPFSSASLFATGDGTIVDVVNESDAATPLSPSIDDDPASPDDNDWVNNAVDVT